VRARHKQHLCLVWAQTRETQQQEWCAARTPVRRLSRSSASWLTSCCVRQGGTAAAVTSSSPCTCCAPSTTLCSGYNLLASTSAKTQRGEKDKRCAILPFRWTWDDELPTFLCCSCTGPAKKGTCMHLYTFHPPYALFLSTSTN